MKLPKGWKVEPLEELCKLKPQSGGTPLSSVREYYDGGSIPWAIIEDITAAGMYIGKTQKKITKLGLANSSARLFPKGTLLFAMYGSIGAMAITDIELATNQAILGIVPDEKLLLTKYLYYYLRLHKKELVISGRGGTQQNLNAKIMKEYPIAHPSVPEQKKIAALLEKAEKLKSMRADADMLTDEFLKSSFYEMFGDPMKNEKKWAAHKGRELFVFTSGKFNPTKNLDNKYPFPTYGGNGVTGYSKEYLVDYGTIVIGRVGAYCGSIHKTDGKIWVTDNAIYIKEFRTEMNLIYLYYLFTRLRLNRFANYSGQPKITQKPLEELDYYIPPKQTQDKFATLVGQVDNLRKSQTHSKQSIEDLFDVLMQKAFKGELII